MQSQIQSLLLERVTAALTSVGKLDFHTGVITPVVAGMVSPHGMAFIDRERERVLRIKSACPSQSAVQASSGFSRS
jgi:hypothetical protein